MPYINDRQFTDHVHNTLALNIIYPKMNWLVQDLNQRLGRNIDMNNAVDYVAIENTGTPRLITIQERFREVKYSNYTDFTIRYTRKYNSNESRRMSEYFKLDADYFLYGIINTDKARVMQATGFVKYVVINIAAFKACADNGLIVVDPNMLGYHCKVMDDSIHCPVITNRDMSSEFIPIDIPMLIRIAPEAIEYQEGY